MFAQHQGIGSILREGTRNLGGSGEPPLNHSAEVLNHLGRICRSTFGPGGTYKLCMSHLEKKTLTTDTTSALSVAEVNHPLVKILLDAAKIQREIFFDGGNTVLLLGCLLIEEAHRMISEGIRASSIVAGYKRANKLLSKELKESCPSVEFSDFEENSGMCKNVEFLLKSYREAQDDNLAQVVKKSLIKAYVNGNIVADNVRCVAIPGGSVSDSFSVSGMGFLREVSGSVSRVNNVKTLILNCDMDLGTSETKGTVLFKTAEDMLSYTKDEHELMRQLVMRYADNQIGAIFVNGRISPAAQQYCNEFGILTMTFTSKYDGIRLARALKGTQVIKLGIPNSEDLGFATCIETRHVGSTKLLCVEASDSPLSTIVLRGNSESMLKATSDAVYSVVGCVKKQLQDKKFFYGGGALQMFMTSLLRSHLQGIENTQESEYAQTPTERMAIEAYATALENFVQVLVENGSGDADTLSELRSRYACNNSDKNKHGAFVSEEGITVCDISQVGVLDHFNTSISAITLCTDAVTQLLSTDEIIMAKPAGLKPATPSPEHWQ